MRFLLAGLLLATNPAFAAGTFSTTPAGCALFAEGGDEAIVYQADAETIVVSDIDILARNMICEREGAQASCSAYLAGKWVGPVMRSIDPKIIDAALVRCE